MPTMSCQNCGKKFHTPACRVKTGRRFCSLACRGLAKRTRVERTCETCGKNYCAVPSEIARGGRFCSHLCWQTSRRAEKACRSCGKTFSVARSSGKKYCSKHCSGRGIATSVIHPCRECGSLFLAQPNVIKKGHGLFCSAKCHGKNRSRHKGEGICRVEIICTQCGKCFLAEAWEVKNRTRRYCSRECASSAHCNYTNEKCLWCGQLFAVRPCEKKKRKRYCSKECHLASCRRGDNRHLVSKQCGECGAIYSVNAYRCSSTRYCSRQCKNAHYLRLCGAMQLSAMMSAVDIYQEKADE